MRDGVLNLTPERIKKNLKEINRIRQLVSDLDELTKLDSPELRLNPEKIESGPFLNELKEQFSFEIDKKNIDIKYSFDVPFFTADKLLLHRALTNILSNAVRHTGPGGKIKLSINLNDKSILINVFNTGDKIPDKEINKVFDRLYRGEYARNTPGTGLGLTIAQKITGIHNGTISIKSEDGTTVTITLPAGEFWYS